MDNQVIEGFHLSPQQKQLWLLQQESDAYRVQCAVGIKGPLRRDLLSLALQRVVGRHEILHTAFHRVAGMDIPLQVIADPAHALSHSEIEFGELDQEKRRASIEAHAGEMSREPFDYERGVVMHTRLLSFGRSEHALLVCLSALSADAWTVWNLVREIARQYGATLEGSNLTGEVVQYADFSEWQNELLEAEDKEQGREFWRKQQERRAAHLTLPLERQNAPKFLDQPRRIRLSVDEKLGAAIDSPSAKFQTTPATLLLSCWQILLGRLTGQEEFAIAVAFDGRRFEYLHEAIGPFGKFLPIHCRLGRDFQYGEILESAQNSLRQAHSRQEYFSKDLARRDDAEESSVAQAFPEIGFEYLDQPVAQEAAGVSFTVEELYDHTERLKLRLTCLRSTGGYGLELYYAPALYDPESMTRLADQFLTLLSEAIRNLHQPIYTLPLLSPAERHQLLVQWNDTAREYQQDACLHQLFEAQAERTPDATALLFQDQQLSYKELNERANQVAHHLRSAGVRAEVLVGLCMERSVEMVVGLLGILKAGGAYVPLDPHYPAERLAFMLEDAGVSVLLTQQPLLHALPEVEGTVLCVDSQWQSIAGEPVENVRGGGGAENLAYVIYTSGSTGRPKGVMIQHGSVVNLVGALEAAIYKPQGELRRVSVNAPFSFDASVKQLVQLVRGRTLCLIPDDVRRDIPALLDYLSEHEVEALDTTPAQLRLLLREIESRQSAEGSAKMPRLVLIGGEAIDARLWQELALDQKSVYFNLYGPTECTVDASLCRINAEQAVPVIGGPVANARLYVLDQQLEPVPVGVTAELFIAGAGIARGYLNRPELTAQRFIPDPFSSEPGSRLYRSGDLARYRSNGELEYVGRVDGQVKVRGYRIELGEVESVLSQHSQVQQCVVLLLSDDAHSASDSAADAERRLVAYVVPRHRSEDEAQPPPTVAPYQLPNHLLVAHQNKNETDYLYEEIFEKQTYMRHGIELDQGACVFDVGANIGLFTLFAMQRCHDARIYAFEPIPPIFESLRLNTKRYGAAVKVFNFGLSDREQVADFTFYPRYTMMSGLSDYADAAGEVQVIEKFLLNEQEQGRTDASQLLAHAGELLEGRFVEQHAQCRLRTLSDVIAEERVERIDLLKVDVQRAELDVLRGIRSEDWSKIEQVVMEVHDAVGEASEGRVGQIVALLESEGFTAIAEQDPLLVGTDRYNLYAVRKGREHSPASDAMTTEQDARAGSSWTRNLQAGELRRYLAEKLPEYMIPSAFVLLDELPLTRHGKVDHSALPRPEEVEVGTDGEAAAPRTPVEELIAGIWQQLLNLSRIGIDDNFFELGGHSLLATQLVSRLRELFSVEVGLRSLFEEPTVRGLSERVEQKLREAAQVSVPPIVAVEREQGGELPLSFAQQRLWFLDQLEPNSAAYNIPTSVRLSGVLDVAALERAINEVLRRHESLRTSFKAVNRQPVQLISPAQALSLALIDLQGLEDAARATEAELLMIEEARRPFDLARGPMLRASLLRLSMEEHLFLLTIHHIASDGWSMTLLMREVAALYEAFTKGEPSPLEQLPVQYADFAVWQREWFSGERLETQLAYWRQHLAGKLPVLALRTARPNTAALAHQGAHETLVLASALRDALKELSRREGTTLYMTALAAFYVLLSRHSGQEDIVVGTDVANRNRSETEPLIGFFVNQLVLRANLSGNPSFREFLKQVRETTLAAYAHQDLPFDKLVETLNPDRAASRTPLFQAKLVFQNAPAGRVELPGLVLTPLNVGGGTGIARFDLLLNLVETNDGLFVSLDYSKDLFDATTIRRLLGNYETLLGSIAARPEALLGELEMLTESEMKELEAQKRRRDESRLKKFKSIKPRIISVPQDRLVRMDELREGRTLALLVQPATDNLDLAEWTQNNREMIERQLLKHGVLLFRGFNVKEQEEFERLLAATSVELMNYFEGSTPRTKLGDKVYTSTEYPPDESIAMHNELTYAITWPMKIWFCCLQPAEERGQTPIADSRRIFQRIDPKIRERFAERGWMLVRNFGDGLSLTWQESFHTDDPAEVERYCRGARIECEWKEGNRLRTRHVRPAIARHPVTGEIVWFNHAAFWHVSTLRPQVRDAMLTMLAEDELPFNTYYGDGSPIESSVIDAIREAYAAETVEFDWQRGDVLMLDNMLTAHGRNSFKGTRRVLVAMGQAFTREDI